MQKEYDYEDILLVKVAWYYYMEGLTQQEIGEYLGLPRLRNYPLFRPGQRQRPDEDRAGADTAISVKGCFYRPPGDQSEGSE